MFSVFPAMLVYYLFGAFVLRMAAAITLFYFTKEHVSLARKSETQKLKYTSYILAAIEVVLGVLLFIGLYTQVAALAGMLIAVTLKVLSFTKSPLASYGKVTYFLLFMVCFSLLFLGAGAFAFDLPL
jgi:uncharacterized membrane protein YkgB